jgi:membrane fusion protein, multidrug efflux system
MKSITTAIVFSIFLSSGCRHTEIKSESAGTLRVKVVPLITETVSIPVHTSGILVTAEELKLSFKTGGIVAKIIVREGEKVRKGDLLASLNLLEINASAEQARNGYDKALRDYIRAENLLKDGSTSLEKKQNAETAMNIAKNSLEIAQFNLKHSRIEAPDNGIVMKQFVKENELVSSGYPVFLFGSSGRYWKVEAGLADRDIIRINPGDSAEVFFDAWPGIKFSALVDGIGEISNPYTGTFKTELILKDAGYRLISGFVASADIFPSVKKAFAMVPLGSVVEADGLHGYIYIVNSRMEARKVYVDIASITGTMAAVTGIPSGVSEIVSEGAAYLRDGVKVEVVK